MKKAQIKVKSHSLLSFRDETISLSLKSCSAALGEFAGRRAWMNAFSLSVSHDAV